MGCPYCQGTATLELARTTTLGYQLFRCRPCRRAFNERTGTPFNHLQVPTDVALLVVLWRLRYKLSLRDLAEMFLTRGFTFTHETVREWEERFAPLLTERLRAKRRGKAGKKWHADETYVRVDGRWCYLYRAIDADGNLVDSMLSETRDMDAAKLFFTRARTVVGDVPEKVTTDGHDAYPRAAGRARPTSLRWATARARRCARKLRRAAQGAWTKPPQSWPRRSSAGSAWARWMARSRRTSSPSSGRCGRRAGRAVCPSQAALHRGRAARDWSAAAHKICARPPGPRACASAPRRAADRPAAAATQLHRARA